MAQHIHHCPHCLRYSMEEKCPSCGTATILPKPPKFSLDDKYAGLRREVKRKELIEKGLY